MPSLVIGQPPLSGAVLVISGNPWSGILLNAGINLRWVGSGICFVGLSGFGPPLSGNFMTINSGGYPLSGGAASGMLDGVPLLAGDSYFIPPAEIGNRGNLTSGTFNLLALADGPGSGGRLYFEPFQGYRGGH